MKLFNKTLRIYLVFSLLIFGISIPVFYALVQDLWMVDVDDSLYYQKEKIIEGLVKIGNDSNDVVAGFSAIAAELDLGIAVIPLQGWHPEKDSVYYKSFYDSTRTHVEPFRELLSFANVNGKSYRIQVRKDLVESIDLVRGIVITQAVLFLFMLTGLLFLNNYFSKIIWRPFYKLVGKLNSFKIDREQSIDPEKTDIDEFNDLNYSIKRLIENNIRIYKAQKEFTENAAHELQTPLAVIKTQAEILAQKDNLSRDQAVVIERINKNIRLLTKLNRNLLLLSKIENQQFETSEEVDIHSILAEVLSAFDEQIGLRGIALTVITNGHPVFKSNAMLVHSLLTNLIINAIKYNAEKGAIGIELAEYEFQVANTGIGRPLPADKIFERFYKTQGQAEGCGLGLAIVKRICELLKFKLEYNFKGNNIHCFAVKFKGN